MPAYQILEFSIDLNHNSIISIKSTSYISHNKNSDCIISSIRLFNQNITRK